MYEVYLTNGETREKLHEMDKDSDRRVSLCEFTDGVNLVPSAEIAMLPFHPCYERIFPMTSLIEIVNTQTGKTEFEGRVLKVPTNGMDSSGIVAKRFTCEGFMGYLYDSVQEYQKLEPTTAAGVLRTLLEQHNRCVPEEKKIEMGMCDFNGTADKAEDVEITYAQTMTEIKRLCLDVFGGELWLRRNDEGTLVLDWLRTPETPILSDTVIELSKNMKSLNCESDATHIVTRLIPLGAKLTDPETGEETEERLTIENVQAFDTGQYRKTENGNYIEDIQAAARYGVLYGTLVLDDMIHVEQLVSDAMRYMSNNNRIKLSYKAEVLDLSTIGLDPSGLKIGKAYRFVNRLIPLDEELRLTKKTVDIFNAHTPTVEIGDKTEKITDIATRAVNFIEYEMPKVKTSILDSAKALANDLINNANNGYIVLDNEKGELLIMNTPDKETATQVWRWNLGGLRYAQSYDGEYTNAAITMDGAIVADFITAGTMYADRIRGGTLTVGGYNNESGIIVVRDNALNEICLLDQNGMKVENASKYWVKLADGALLGGYQNDQYVTLNATAKLTNTDTGRVYNGLLLRSDAIDFRCDMFAVNGKIGNSAQVPIVKKINKADITYSNLTVVTDVWIDNNGDLQKNTTNINYVSNVDIGWNSDTITFTNGLMTTKFS